MGKNSWNNRDETFKLGSRHIDSIAMSEGLMTFIEGFEIIEWYENASKDHIGHVVEPNLEKFFNENLHEID